MKRLLLASLALLAPRSAPASSAPASPAPSAPAPGLLAAGDALQRARLPADVDFVVHFDLEGFKQTQLWKKISEGPERRAFEEGMEELHEIQERFGIDPFTDVRAVTLYKVQSEEDPTVVLFSTTPQIDAALRRFQSEFGYEQVVHAGIELHSWKEEDGEVVFAYLHASSESERVVVLSSHADSAVRAARVLRGEEPSHASSGTLLEVAPAPGSFLYLAAAQIPHLDEFTPASRVFGLAQGIQVDLGEAGGFLRGHLGVTTASAQDAFDISNVVNGLLSLARLAGSELQELVEVLNGLRLSTSGSRVVLDFEYGVERLLEALRSLEDLDSDSGADEDD